jgi:hypothetical protein
MAVRKRKYIPLDQKLGVMAAPQNKHLHAFFRIMAKLLNVDVRDIIKDGYIKDISNSNIFNARVKFSIKLPVRKWITPTFHSENILTSFKKGDMLLVRDNGDTLDIEHKNDIFTIYKQDWNEKSGYLSIVNPQRLRGPLGTIVKNITEIRRAK